MLYGNTKNLCYFIKFSVEAMKGRERENHGTKEPCTEFDGQWILN